MYVLQLRQLLKCFRYSLDPLPRVLCCINKVSLGASLSRVIIILPPCSFWQGHEDAFCTSSSLQSENGSTVVDKVELNITSPPHLLPILLLWSEFIIPVLLNDRSIGVDNIIAQILDEIKDCIRITVVKIIEEDTTKTTSFATMLDLKVFVGPLFEFGVVLRIMLITNLLERSMEVLHIILIDVAGSNILTTTEPPNATIRFKVAVVKMHGWAMRIARVHNAGQSSGEEWDLAIRSRLGAVAAALGRSRQSFRCHGSVNDGQGDASLLPHLAVDKDSRTTTAAIGTDPCILLEFCAAINVLNGLRDANLCLTEHLFHLATHGVVAIRTIFVTNK
mmetsp:Transcript_11489/g.23545  ORF Transcript_11489/g.23545 Transcript_11489/m.23545 type:complete len:334 (+) Transcript_11489:778-1779(+)